MQRSYFNHGEYEWHSFHRITKWKRFIELKITSYDSRAWIRMLLSYRILTGKLCSPNIQWIWFTHNLTLSINHVELAMLIWTSILVKKWHIYRKTVNSWSDSRWFKVRKYLYFETWNVSFEILFLFLVINLFINRCYTFIQSFLVLKFDLIMTNGKWSPHFNWGYIKSMNFPLGLKNATEVPISLILFYSDWITWCIEIEIQANNKDKNTLFQEITLIDGVIERNHSYWLESWGIFFEHDLFGQSFFERCKLTIICHVVVPIGESTLFEIYSQLMILSDVENPQCNLSGWITLQNAGNYWIAQQHLAPLANYIIFQKKSSFCAIKNINSIFLVIFTNYVHHSFLWLWLSIFISREKLIARTFAFQWDFKCYTPTKTCFTSWRILKFIYLTIPHSIHSFSKKR